MEHDMGIRIGIRTTILFSLMLLLFCSCQQKIDDDQDQFSISGSLPYFHIMTAEFDSNITDASLSNTITVANDYNSGDVFVFTNYFTTGIRYTMYFHPFDSPGVNYLWSGEEGTRHLVLFDRGITYQPLPMQRPLKIAFEVTVSGEYTIIMDSMKMTYSLSNNPGLFQNENEISSVQFISSFPGTGIADTGNYFTVAGDSLRLVVTNLVPGMPIPFRIVYNGNTNEALGKQQYNHMTTGNNLLDSLIYQRNDNLLASFTPTSEMAFIYFNPYSRTFTVDQPESPQFGDGYLGSDMYGPAYITNTGQNISNIFIHNLGNAWYFAVEGTLAGTNGLPVSSGGVRCVLLIDDTSSTAGVSGSWLQLYERLPFVYIPSSQSVEYILVLESNPADPGVDGPDMLQSNAVKLYGPLSATMTNFEHMLTNERRFLQYSVNSATNGFFKYGDVYEVVIPIHTTTGSNTGPLPVTSMEICMLSWSAHTNWYNYANTNLQWPIVYANPAESASNVLSAGWIAVP